MKCLNCNEANHEPTAKFCHVCGVSLFVKVDNKCPTCGTEIVIGARFCYNCGTKIEYKSKVETETRKRKETFVINGPFNSASFVMIRVDGGEFWMGNTFDNFYAADDSGPVHKVTLSTFMMGETVVTKGLWNAVMGRGVLRESETSLPMVNISWLDCQKFIKELNSITGKKFRLPTEAEWEYAARGGKKTHNYKYSGSQNIDDVGWYFGNSKDELHAVAQKSPNELNLYDMSGLIYEWCDDKYGFYSKEPQINPRYSTDSNRSLRVLRGGSIDGNRLCHDYCKVCSRNNSSPGKRYDTVGMRLVL